MFEEGGVVFVGPEVVCVVFVGPELCEVFVTLELVVCVPPVPDCVEDGGGWLVSQNMLFVAELNWHVPGPHGVPTV